MPYNHPHQVIGFHSCDKEVGLQILNGQADLLPSTNNWDWLGNGIYFWEENPMRALHYAEENAAGTQFNKVRIRTPFVIGAIIDLGNCLNLVETDSLKILKEAYNGLRKVMKLAGKKMPVNKGPVKRRDCAVFQYITQTNDAQGKPPYDTVRCAFAEGGNIYPGSTVSEKLHLQICVMNPDCIKGYFLPRPIGKYNPNLKL